MVKHEEDIFYIFLYAQYIHDFILKIIFIKRYYSISEFVFNHKEHHMIEQTRIMIEQIRIVKKIEVQIIYFL